MKIRKIEQGTVPSTSRVLTEFNESKLDTYSCNTINTMLNSLESNDPLPVGTILDFDGDEIPEGYGLVDEEDSYDVYSTEEQVIGRWIDNKPLYRKVIYIGELPNDTNITVPIDLVSSEIRLTKISGVSHGINGLYQTGLNDKVTRLMLTPNGLNVACSGDFRGMMAYAILEYTKTTD